MSVFIYTGINSISSFLHSCGTAYRRLVGKSPQEKLELEVLREIQGSYFDLDRSSVEAMKKWNDRLLKELNALPLSGPNRGRKGGLLPRKSSRSTKRWPTTRWPPAPW